MYWAVPEFGRCVGIEVMASNNPTDYNGMKIVKSGSWPLDVEKEF
jgi:phosphomannomutase